MIRLYQSPPLLPISSSSQKRNYNHDQQGFTLLEVMIAIAIFSVIALGCWQVLDRVTTTKSHLEKQSAQLRELQRGLWLLARDIHSIVNRPIRNSIGEQEAAVTTLVTGYTLLLTRNGWPNPLGEKRSTLQRVGYQTELDKNGNNTLFRYYWPVLDQAPDTEPQQQVILENVDYFEVQFIDSQGNVSFHWPEKSNNENKTSDHIIPAGIRIRLNVSHYGEIERTFAIRSIEEESS